MPARTPRYEWSRLCTLRGPGGLVSQVAKALGVGAYGPVAGKSIEDTTARGIPAIHTLGAVIVIKTMRCDVTTLTAATIARNND